MPTVVDRVIQQAIAQKLQGIWEPEFSDGSYGYRPKRSAQQAIQRVKKYAQEGYTYAVSIDLSKYFDALNHELLMELLRREVQDKRVLGLVKKYLKSGVMEDGVVYRTEEGSPQGGPLSPLLANIYLNEFDQEMGRRGVKLVRYADDIVLFARSRHAAECLLESGWCHNMVDNSNFLPKKNMFIKVPITAIWISLLFEKQMVLRASRLIRVLNVK